MSEVGWLTKNLPQLADRFNTRWLIADYEAGDMMIHSAYMIHAATVNNDPNGHMRLSTDIRYQRLRDEIDVRWQNHWSFDDSCKLSNRNVLRELRVKLGRKLTKRATTNN